MLISPFYNIFVVGPTRPNEGNVSKINLFM